MPSPFSTSKLPGATGLAAEMMVIWAVRIRVGAVGERVIRLNRLESKLTAPPTPPPPQSRIDRTLETRLVPPGGRE